MGAPKKAYWREERRKRAWGLKEQGWKHKNIAVALGVCEGAVSQWLLPRARAGSGSIWNSLKRVEGGTVCCADLEQLSTAILLAGER